MHLRKEGLVLGVLVLVRIIASYLQQAFLWEAALNCVYKIRVYVFNRVLQRDLGFFEGEKGVLPGDIAYRITAEASDVGDTVYSLLDVSFSILLWYCDRGFLIYNCVYLVIRVFIVLMIG